MSGTLTRIRHAEAADLHVITQYNMFMAKETENLDLAEKVVWSGVAAVFSDPSKGRYYLAEVGGNAVAQLMITYEWSDWRDAQMWWIQSVYVHPDYRKQGLFRMLYKHVRSEASAARAGGLRLYVDKSNTRAQSTYEAMGMKSHYDVFEEEFHR